MQPGILQMKPRPPIQDTKTRRAAIRQLMRSHVVATQEELRRLLAKEGFTVTQATLSRDLAQLGARRVAMPGGGTAYELEVARAPSGREALLAVAPMVLEIIATDTLVVVHTLPGSAQVVAAAVDGARGQEYAGSVAGDDTLFVAPCAGVSARQLRRHLAEVLLAVRPPPSRR